MIANRRLLAAGLALIVLTNAVALGGVAWNRAGEPDSRLALGERELVLPWRSAGPEAENSGLSLQLRWRCLPAPVLTRHGITYGDPNTPAWLDARKMVELGFDPRPPGQARPPDRAPPRHQELAREVWLVLELDGPAYRQSQAAAAQAMEAAASQPAPLRADADAGSRLFAVDAGLDRDALRARHPDRSTCAIVRARVAPRLGSEAATDGGRIDSLSVAEVNVPLALRQVFDGLQPPPYNRRPNRHFDATLAFGRRAEPWLVDARGAPDSH